MASKYIIGVDGGSQSSKVVIYDLEGNAVCEGRQVLRPMSRPGTGSWSIRTTTCGTR